MPYIVILLAVASTVAGTVVLLGPGTLPSWVSAATGPAILVVFGAALMSLGSVVRRRATERAPLPSTEPWSNSSPESSPTAV